MTWRVLAYVLLLLLVWDPAAAEDMSPMSKSGIPKDITSVPKPPAKELFGAVTAPAPLTARAIGTYAKGCLAGAVSLPISGPDWQVMRLSRNRNWGHPRLLNFP